MKYSLVTSQKGVKRVSMEVLYSILTVQGRHFQPRWVDFVYEYSKVVSVFKEIPKLSGAITARMGSRTVSV